MRYAGLTVFVCGFNRSREKKTSEVRRLPLRAAVCSRVLPIWRGPTKKPAAASHETLPQWDILPGREKRARGPRRRRKGHTAQLKASLFPLPFGNIVATFFRLNLI